MKRIVSTIGLLIALVITSWAQSLCRVSVTFSGLRGPDQQATLTVFRVLLNGATYSNKREVFRVNSSGVLLGADGAPGVQLPQGAVVWLYSNSSAVPLIGLDANPNNGTPYQVPNKSSATIYELQGATTLFRALGDLVYGGVDGLAARLAGNTSATPKVFTQKGTGSASAAPDWWSLEPGSGITVTPDASGKSFVIASTVSGGTLTQVNTGNGLSGGPITGVGQVDIRLNASGGLSKTLGAGSNELGLTDSGALPGTYFSANVTVDAKGRITAIGNGVAGTQVTFREVDGSPSFVPNTVEFQQADGFVFTDQGSGVGRLSLSGVPFSKLAAITANRALATNGSGVVVASSVTDTELGYVAGVTSAIQTQINAKAASSHTHPESDITNLVTDLAAKVAASRLVSTGNGLQGGGDLSADRTVDLRLNSSGGLSKTLGGGSNELGIATAGVSNAMLANSAITIQGSPVSLGGSTLATNAVVQFGQLGIGASPTGLLEVSGTQNASAGVARAIRMLPTLVATADNDVLTGIFLNPTFTNGSFASVTNYLARWRANGSADVFTVNSVGDVVGNSFSGAGSGLTALNASNLGSGTVPDARFPTTLPAASGVNLTALNASNLASGTVPLARLSGITTSQLDAAANITNGQLAGSITYAKLQNVSATNRLLGRSTAGAGVIEEVTPSNSVVLSGGNLSLSGDSGSPGNSKYYGTDSGGTKGYFSLPSSSAPFADNAAIVKNNSDNTKLLILDASLLTTGTTRTLKAQDGNYSIAGIDFANTFSSAQKVSGAAFTSQRDSIGATSTDGIVLDNTTAAAAGAQQWSPRIRLSSRGWKTTATAASQQTDWIFENQSVQGAASPTTNLSFSSQVNGGGYAEVLNLQSGTGAKLTGKFMVNGGVYLGGGLFGTTTFYLSNNFSDGTANTMFTLASNGGAGRFQFKNTFSLTWSSNGDSASGTYDATILRTAAASLSLTGSSSTTAATLGTPPNTPAQITADQNNYAPGTGWFQRWSSDASRNVTGLVAGQSGDLVEIWNVGSQNIVLQNENASSTAANRFTTSTAADLTLTPSKCAKGRYDNTSARWRIYLCN